MTSASEGDEESAWLLAESIRWAAGDQRCPHCGAPGPHYYLAPRAPHRVTSTGRPSFRRLWKCTACRKQFSVLVGTALAGSRLPLSLWLQAVVLLCERPGGMTAHELSRELGITPKSAGQLGRRIRLAVAQTTPDVGRPRLRNEKPINTAGGVDATLRQLLRPVARDPG